LQFQQRAQLKSLRDQLSREIEHHESQSERNKKRLKELEREEHELAKKQIE
jgi:uncharacterized membrane protein YjjP (DUF1212 family)